MGISHINGEKRNKQVMYMTSAKLFSMNLFYREGSNNNLRNSTSAMIAYDIKTECACSKIDYVKLKTGGNDPTLSTRAKYAQYIRNNGRTQGTGLWK